MLSRNFPRLANWEFWPTKQGSLFTDQGTISTPFWTHQGITREASAEARPRSDRAHKIVGKREQEIDPEEQQALEPGGLAIRGDRPDDERRTGNREEIERTAEDQIHRLADKSRCQHQHGCHHESGLDRRADAYGEHDVHLIL